MPRYTHPETLSDRFNASLIEVARMTKLFQSDLNDKCIADLSNCRFTYPIFIAALASLRLKREIQIIAPKDSAVYSYLEAVRLINTVPTTELNEAFFANYLNKTYLPVVIYPATRLGTATTEREAIHQALFDLLKTQLKGIDKEVLYALDFFISEFVNNTVDHSGEELSLLLAQYYEKKRYIDLCIVDGGKSILGSYLEQEPNLNISAAEAITKALSGDSTKQRPKNERGFGISKSREMLTKGLKGEFFLWSDRGLVITSSSENQILFLPENFSWKGTFVFLRIPSVAPKGFTLSDYYE